MDHATSSRERLLAYLKEEIEKREERVEEIRRSILVLRGAEQELLRLENSGDTPASAVEPEGTKEEPAEALPYRIQSSPAAASAEAPSVGPSTSEPEETVLQEAESAPSSADIRIAEAPPPAFEMERPTEQVDRESSAVPSSSEAAPLGAAAGGPAHPSEAEAGLPPEEKNPGMGEIAAPADITPAPEPPIPAKRPITFQIDESPQEVDRPPLIDMEERQEQAAHRAAAETAETPPPAEEVGPPPGEENIPEEPSRASEGTSRRSLTSIQHLKAYIREGGAIRCLDPWDQLCSAFVLRAEGSAIFATDAFLIYLRKFLRRLHELLEEQAEQGGGSRAASSILHEVEARKSFLGSLVGAVAGRRMNRMQRVLGLKLAGGEPRPEDFEFEQATETVVYPAVLERLKQLLERPVSSFFEADGPYEEIADYLKKCQEFARNLGEERRAASLLDQVGPMRKKEQRRGGEAPRSSPAPLYDAEGQLPDLSAFGYEPGGRQSILAQSEPALSNERFQKLFDEITTSQGAGLIGTPPGKGRSSRRAEGVNTPPSLQTPSASATQPLKTSPMEGPLSSQDPIPAARSEPPPSAPRGVAGKSSPLPPPFSPPPDLEENQDQWEEEEKEEIQRFLKNMAARSRGARTPPFGWPPGSSLAGPSA